VRAIPETFLRYAFSVYFDGSSAGRDADEIFETGLTWATDPCDAHRAVLEQASESGEAFIIAEVAVEEAFERSEQYSEAAWQQLLGEVKGTPDEAVVAKAAAGQGFTALSFRAIQDMLQPKAVASDAQASAQAVWNESLRREQARFPAAPERDRSRPPTIPDRPLSQPRSFMLAALYRRTALWAGLRTTALLTSDILGVWAAVLGAYCITEKRVDFWRAQESTDQRIAYASLLVVVLFSVVGLYRRRSRRGNAPRVIAALTQGMIGVLALRSLIGLSIGSYALLGWAYLFSCVTVTSLRGSLTELGVWAANRARGRKMHSALVGTRAQVEPVAAVMANDERAGEILGYIGPLEGEPDQGRLRHLGEGRTELGWLRLMTMHDIDELVLCDPIASEDFAGMLAGIAGRTGVKLKAVAPTRDFLVAVSRYTPGEPLPLEELRRPQFERPEYAVKRAFDVSVSATLLVVLLVPAIIVAGVIKVTSRRGRVIEKIPYPGPNNSIFWLYKFRIAHLSDAGIPLSKPTFAGRLIQAVGFDEVPQLLNVLRGNMSLVGPRPISQRDYSRLPDWQQARNEVLPGITGLWQISGRHDSTFGAMMSLDLYYVQRWSLFLDVEILLKTIGAALRNRRAELEVPVEPARRPRRISEKRAAFGPSLLAALPRHGGITFEEALEIAVASGGEAREVLRWLTRVERNGWLDISPTDAGHTFALSELGALRSAEDRRRRVSY
jgi:lipopolysaccharide/colanic/teichoic acid biosynthesis glycosyltransferase